MTVRPDRRPDTEPDHAFKTGRFISEASWCGYFRSGHPAYERISVAQIRAQYHDIDSDDELSIIICPGRFRSRRHQSEQDTPPNDNRSPVDSLRCVRKGTE